MSNFKINYGMILGYSVVKQTEFLCRYKRVLLYQRIIMLRLRVKN